LVEIGVALVLRAELLFAEVDFEFVEVGGEFIVNEPGGAAAAAGLAIDLGQLLLKEGWGRALFVSPGFLLDRSSGPPFLITRGGQRDSIACLLGIQPQTASERPVAELRANQQGDEGLVGRICAESPFFNTLTVTFFSTITKHPVVP